MGKNNTWYRVGHGTTVVVAEARQGSTEERIMHKLQEGAGDFSAAVCGVIQDTNPIDQRDLGIRAETVPAGGLLRNTMTNDDLGSRFLKFPRMDDDVGSIWVDATGRSVAQSTRTSRVALGRK